MVKGKTNAPAPSKKLSPDELREKYAEAAQRADSGGLNRIVLEKGDNIIKIVDPDFRENFVVFIQDTEGADKRVSMGMDMKESKEKYAVVFDTFPDVNASHRYYFKAIQGKNVKTEKGIRKVLDNEVKLLEVGPTIFKQIAAIASDPEFGNDITAVNLKITRTGEKLKTDYQVMPMPKSTPIPTDLTGDVDLDALVEETPLATVYGYLGEEYTESETTEETTEETVEDVVETVEETTEESGDGFDDMDRKELLKYIKQYELGITVYKNWTDDQIRDAIRAKIAELQAAEAEATSEEQETEVEAEVEETIDDNTVVEEDDLSGLDDLDDLEEEKAPAPPAKTSKPAVKKPGKK